MPPYRCSLCIAGGPRHSPLVECPQKLDKLSSPYERVDKIREPIVALRCRLPQYPASLGRGSSFHSVGLSWRKASNGSFATLRNGSAYAVHNDVKHRLTLGVAFYGNRRQSSSHLALPIPSRAFERPVKKVMRSPTAKLDGP